MNPIQLFNLESWNDWKNTTSLVPEYVRSRFELACSRFREVGLKHTDGGSAPSYKNSGALFPDFQFSTFGLGGSFSAYEVSM